MIVVTPELFLCVLFDLGEERVNVKGNVVLKMRKVNNFLQIISGKSTHPCHWTMMD